MVLWFFRRIFNDVNFISIIRKKSLRNACDAHQSTHQMNRQRVDATLPAKFRRHTEEFTPREFGWSDYPLNEYLEDKLQHQESPHLSSSTDHFKQ